MPCKNRYRFVRQWAALPCLIIATACASVADDDFSLPSVPNQFVNADTVDLGEEERSRFDEPWYEAYQDERLNAIVEKAQRHNLDVVVAVANLDVAKAQLAVQETSLLPVLDGFLSSRLDLISAGDDNLSAGSTLGLTGSFDPDIAGGNRARTRAIEQDLRQAEFDLADVDRLIVQAVVLEYIDLRRAEARLALLDETLALQEQTLTIVTARFNVGLSAALDVDRAAADLASSRSQRGLFEADQKQSAYILDVLQGESCGQTDFTSDVVGQIPQYRGQPELGLPTDLLRNRPDVRAGEASFLSSLDLIAAERADLMPRLTLPGTVSAIGGYGRDALSGSLSGVIDLPILDFGRRQSEVEAQQARARAAFARYSTTVLNAHREVETALTNVSALRERLDELEQAGERSQSAYDQLEALYREGLAGFIDILDAQRTLIQIREQIVETEANLASALAQLSASLGLKTA